jgi:hypothetical protein
VGKERAICLNAPEPNVARAGEGIKLAPPELSRDKPYVAIEISGVRLSGERWVVRLLRFLVG